MAHGPESSVGRDATIPEEWTIRISYSEAEHRTPPLATLLQPLVAVTNLATAAVIYPSVRTARISWSPSLDELAEPGGGPLIYYTWSANEQLGQIVFRDCPEALIPTAIGHDGILSRMHHRAPAWYGLPVWIFRRDSPVRARQQIIEMMRETGHPIALLVDSGGPYGQLKEGVVDIARATGARVVPFTVRGRGVVTLRRPAPYRVPLPFCSLKAYRGPPIPPDEVSLDRCRDALERQEARAERLARGQAEGTHSAE